MTTEKPVFLAQLNQLKFSKILHKVRENKPLSSSRVPSSSSSSSSSLSLTCSRTLFNSQTLDSAGHSRAWQHHATDHSRQRRSRSFFDFVHFHVRASILSRLYSEEPRLFPKIQAMSWESGQASHGFVGNCQNPGLVVTSLSRPLRIASDPGRLASLK